MMNHGTDRFQLWLLPEMVVLHGISLCNVQERRLSLTQMASHPWAALHEGSYSLWADYCKPNSLEHCPLSASHVIVLGNGNLYDYARRCHNYANRQVYTQREIVPEHLEGSRAKTCILLKFNPRPCNQAPAADFSFTPHARWRNPAHMFAGTKCSDSISSRPQSQRANANCFPSHRPTQQRARLMEETGLAHAPPPRELHVAAVAAKGLSTSLNSGSSYSYNSGSSYSYDSGKSSSRSYGWPRFKPKKACKAARYNLKNVFALKLYGQSLIMPACRDQRRGQPVG